MSTLPTTPAGWINRHLQRVLKAKQQEMRANQQGLTFAMLDQHYDAKQVRAAQAAVNRNQKSIALIVAKLLCQHTAAEQPVTINGSPSLIVRCGLCKTSTVKR